MDAPPPAPAAIAQQSVNSFSAEIVNLRARLIDAVSGKDQVLLATIRESLDNATKNLDQAREDALRLEVREERIAAREDALRLEVREERIAPYGVSLHPIQILAIIFPSNNFRH